MEINVLRDCGWFNLTFFIFFILPEVDFSLIIFEYKEGVNLCIYFDYVGCCYGLFDMWVDSYIGDNEVNIMLSSIFLRGYNAL